MSIQHNAATRIASSNAHEGKQRLEVAIPADGTYEGLQSGYVCTFKAPYASRPEGTVWNFQLNTETGVRGHNIPAKVVVTNGAASIYL